MELFSDNDIATEILSRLPVKSLVAFKCTAKRWNSFVSDPLFLSIYYQRSKDVTGVRIMQLMTSGGPRNGQDLVGLKVKIMSLEYERYRKGVIDSFDASEERHKVSYNDGDEEILILRKEKWAYVLDDSSPDAEAEDEPARTDFSSEVFTSATIWKWKAMSSKSGKNKVQTRKTVSKNKVQTRKTVSKNKEETRKTDLSEVREKETKGGKKRQKSVKG